MHSRLSAFWGVLLLAACQSPPPGADASQPAPAPIGAPGWVVDGTDSALHILVFRAGTMAGIGHNHVLSLHGLSGRLRWEGEATDAWFELEVPLDRITVDDPLLRSAEGAEFATPINNAARAATLGNMLGPRLLDAARYPVIRVRSAAMVAEGAEWRVRVVATVRERSYAFEVPVTLHSQEERLHVAARWTLKQSDLGLTPYSVLMGRLQVADDMQLRLQLHFRRAPSGLGVQ